MFTFRAAAELHAFCSPAAARRSRADAEKSRITRRRRGAFITFHLSTLARPMRAGIMLPSWRPPRRFRAAWRRLMPATNIFIVAVFFVSLFTFLVYAKVQIVTIDKSQCRILF